MKDTQSQTSLFNPTKYKTSQQVQKHQEWLNSLTPEDKAYLSLLHHGIALRNHIYEGKQCKARLSFYITNGNLFGETTHKLYKIMQKINPRGYYHCVVTKYPFKVSLYRYDTFLMTQIDKSLNNKTKK